MKKFSIAMLVLALPYIISADPENDLRHNIDKIHLDCNTKINNERPFNLEKAKAYHEDMRSEVGDMIDHALAENPQDLGVLRVDLDFRFDKMLHTKEAFDKAKTAKEVNIIMEDEAENIGA
jgi:hypothetical protein